MKGTPGLDRRDTNIKGVLSDALPVFGNNLCVGTKVP